MIDNAAIAASAGSGKTYQLTLRFIELLYKGADANDILCITFTRKASKEMKDKIIEKLSDIAYYNSINKIEKKEEIEKFVTQLVPNEKIETVTERTKQIYKNLYSSSLNITTIDAFLLSVLRLFSFDAGVPFEFDIANEEEKKLLLSKSMRLFADDILNKEELKAYLFEFASLNNVKNILDFIENNIAPLMDIHSEFEYLNLSMENRPDTSQLMDSKQKLCSFLIKNKDLWGSSKNIVTSFCSSNNPNEFLSLISKDLPDNRNFKKDAVLPILTNLWSDFKEQAKTFIENKTKYDSMRFLKLFDVLQKHYNLVASKENMLTFSDIQNYVYKLLVKEGMDKDYLYFRLDSNIRHLLIDEFQDTSFMQWLILKPLVDELISGKGVYEQEGSFFYVGDKKQSIYRFRGAESSLFDVPVAEYKEKIKTERLKVNRRSAKNIVDFINRIFVDIDELFEYKPVECISNYDGYVELNSYENEEMLLENLADSIFNLIKKGYPINKITILARTNGDVDKISNHLMENGIAVSSETTSSIVTTDVSKVLINILKYLISPQAVYKETVLSYIMSDDFDKKINLIKNDINTTNNSLVLAKIIELFGIDSAFENDENLLKITDAAADLNGLDFVEFVFRLETIVKSEPKAETSNDKAVKIMTVHKSKGLEFDIVFVPMLKYNQTVNTNFIMMRDENLAVCDFIARINKKHTIYSDKIKLIYESESNKSRTDELNTLYVALTRAKDMLFVYGVSKGNKLFQKLSETIGEKYIRGEIKKIKQKSVKNKIEEHNIYKKITTSNTRIEPKEQMEGSLKNRLFGDALHKALEVIKEFSKEYIDIALAIVQSHYGLYLEDKDFKDLKELLILLFENDNFKKLTDGELMREQAFFDGGSIKRVDLIVDTGNYLNIIDYKTSSPIKPHEEYKKQVLTYCEIAEQVYGKPANGYLVFLQKNQQTIEQIKLF